MLHKLIAKHRKGIKRSLSLTLCLALLLSTWVTMAAFATTEDTASTETIEEVEAVTEVEAAEDIEAAEEVDAAEEVEAAEEVDAAEEVEIAEILEVSENAITVAAANAAATNKPGTGSSTSTISVYYDRVTTSGSTTTPTLTARNDSTGIASVTVDGNNVAHANGGSSSISSSETTATLTYNTSDTTSTTAVTVTPEDGYYVTFIAVCCCGSGAAQNCTTYSGGNAYSGKFTIESAGSVTVNVAVYNEEGFHHSSDSSTYFIMVAVAKIPTPLYVEYNYGEIVDLIGDADASTAFSTTDGWTTTASGNNYGATDIGDTYGVLTNATQYKYVYPSDSDSASAGWVHYANSVTAQAKAQAAAAGYYFAGWQATYYTDCTESDSSDGYNNYTYNFSSQYGSSSDYLQEGDNVNLTVHVKLTAIWVQATVEPGSLTISKEFVGLDASEYPSSITVTVTKDDTTVGTLTLNNENGWAATLSDLDAGEYVITESGYDVDGYVCTDDSATVYLTAGTISGAYNSSTGLYEYSGSITGASAILTNSYVAYDSLTVVKTWTDNDQTRPDSVEVQLLDGEEVVETVILSADNDWTYTWDQLDPIEDHDWSVSEVEVDGYTAEYTIEDGLITINNVGDIVEEPETEEPETEEPETEEPETEEPESEEPETEEPESEEPDAEEEAEEESEESLAQTGQMFWPIILFYILGVCAIVVGTRMMRDNRKARR